MAYTLKQLLRDGTLVKSWPMDAGVDLPTSLTDDGKYIWMLDTDSGGYIVVPGTGWAEAVVNGDSLTGKEGLLLKIDNGSAEAADMVQPLTNAQFIAAVPPAITGYATSAKQDTALIELMILNGSYAMQVDDAGSGVTYQGWAAPGTAVAEAAWRIRRITATGDDYAIEWQDGDANFDNKWTERITSAAYS